MKATAINNWIDILTLVVYFLLVFALGFWSVCRKEKRTVKGFFLAGRAMHWLPIGASLFSSNIGSEHFIGLAGSGAASGIAVAAFEWGAVLLLLLLGWVFLPIYIRARIFTIPEYLSKRFGGQRLRLYLSVMALVFAVMTKISVDIFAGAVFIQQALGWNIYLSIVILLVVTAIYTVAGGLATVIITDTLHTTVMLIGSMALAILAFIKVGGIEALKMKYMESIPNIYHVNNITNFTSINTTLSKCGYPPADAFHIFRDPVTSNLPWPGVLIRSTFVSVWYWCTDQVIVQRVLAAKNLTHARAATILAGYLKILPLFLMILPGMISRVLFADTVACADAKTCMEVCENPVGCSNVAYPQLVLGLAPIGMRGLMIAVIVASVMSSLTSIFNSAATIFTMDIWTRLRAQAVEGELLIVGRIFVVILVFISVAWVPLITSHAQGQLFIYIQAINGYMAPPVCALFLLAIFIPRVNEKGAFVGLIIGQATGLVRMSLDFVYPAPHCGEADDRPTFMSKFNFTYFSAVLLLITAIVMVVVSLLTDKQQSSQMESLTFWNLAVKSQKKSLSTPNIRNTLNPSDNDNDEGGDLMKIKSGSFKEETETKLLSDESRDLMKIKNGLDREEVLSDQSRDLMKITSGSDRDETKTDIAFDIKFDNDVTLQSLYIKPKMNWILNINAVLVICVFVALYGIFH